jgi:hypothetical protein
MTKLNGGKLAGDGKENGDAEFYVFALPAGCDEPLPERVIHRATGEKMAAGLCALFEKRPSSAPPGTRFCYRPALLFSAEDQIVVEEVLDCLEGYGHPNPDVYAAKPSAEVLWRGQCAARARKWDRRMREKIRAGQAQRLQAMVVQLAEAAMPTSEGRELSDEERVAAALRLVMSATKAQGTEVGQPTDRDGRIKLGRLEYRPGFDEVWVDGQRFDLTTRIPARRCLQFLVEKEAFDVRRAREFAEIHAFVVEELGSMANEPRIHHYFNDAKRKLTRLRSELIKPVARTGRYYLAV